MEWLNELSGDDGIDTNSTNTSGDRDPEPAGSGRSSAEHSNKSGPDVNLTVLLGVCLGVGLIAPAEAIYWRIFVQG